MVSFEPTEEQCLMRDAVAQFANTVLADQIREVEAARAVPVAICRSAHELGLSMVRVPETCGGSGLGWLTEVLVQEQLGRVDAGAAAALPGPGAYATALLELGRADQAQRLLAPFATATAHDRFGAVAWSEPKAHPDRPGLCTTAIFRDGSWVLSGQKAFVTHASLAHHFIVFAQVEPEAGWSGLGAFLIDGDNPGLKRGARYQTLGLDAADFGELTLVDAQLAEDARLDEAEDFAAATLRFFAKQALVTAARAVGLAQTAYDLALEYCDTRVAFGKPIGHFQAVAFNLADCLMDVEAARCLLWEAAWSWDAGKDERHCLAATAHGVSQALITAMRCSDDCVSLHGGAGFIRDLVAEKLMRDAKQLALCCPTVGQLAQIATNAELAAPFDPGLLLPTPETQAIFT